MKTDVPPVDVPPTDRDTLDRSALSGIAWSGAARWSTQLIAWTGTILVARILIPSDYGVVTMASVFLGIVMMLSEFGVGTSVVMLRELPEEELRQLNSVAFLLGVGGTLLTAAMAYPLGLFFRAPHLPPVLAVIGLTFLLTSLQTVPAALLRREFRFRTLAGIEVCRGLVTPVVTLVGAMLGLRYWALVLGAVVGSLITTALTLIFRRVSFARPRLHRLTHVFHFSRDLLVSRLAWIAYQDGDFAVAGRRLGEAALGSYTLAWTLANTPIEKVTTLLSDVTPSLFSAVQNDRPAMKRYFLNLSEALCFAILPASIGLALVSHDTVTVLLGPKWEGTAGPLAVLAIYAGARSVSTLYGHVFVAVRQTRYAMWTSVVLAVLLLAGFVVGSYWGAMGIAAAWLIIHPAVSIFIFRRVQQILDLKITEYLKALRLGVDGSIVMIIVVEVFERVIAQNWPASLRLAVSVLVGAGTFGLTMWGLHRTRVRNIIDWVRRLRSGTSP